VSLTTCSTAPTHAFPVPFLTSRGLSVVPEDRSHSGTDVVRVDRIAETVAVPEAGTPLEQEGHNRGVLPPIRRRKDRRPAVAIGRREVRAAVEQGLHRLDVAIARGPVQRCAAVTPQGLELGGIRVHHPAEVVGLTECRRGAGVDAGPARTQQGHERPVIGCVGVVRRCQQEGRFTELVLDPQRRAGIQENGNRVGLVPLDRPVERGRPVWA